MGCKESKHAVTIADTISKSRSNSIKSKEGEARTNIEYEKPTINGIVEAEKNIDHEKPTVNDVKMDTKTVLQQEENGNEIIVNDSAKANVKGTDKHVSNDSKEDKTNEGINLKAEEALEALVDADDATEKKESEPAFDAEDTINDVNENKESDATIVVDNTMKDATKEKESKVVAVVNDTKDAIEKKELKEKNGEELKEKKDGAKEQEEESLEGPDSLNQFVTPNKDEEIIQSVVSDGIYTPRIDENSSKPKPDLNDVMDEEGSTLEDETQTKNDEALNRNKANQITKESS